MPPSIKGSLLGFATASAVAMMVQVLTPAWIAGYQACLVFAMGPAIVLGAMIGVLAGKLHTNRAQWLVAAAAAAVIVAGAMVLVIAGNLVRGPSPVSLVAFGTFGLVAWPPAVLAALILEAWTRPVGPTPLPIAVARLAGAALPDREY